MESTGTTRNRGSLLTPKSQQGQDVLQQPPGAFEHDSSDSAAKLVSTNKKRVLPLHGARQPSPKQAVVSDYFEHHLKTPTKGAKSATTAARSPFFIAAADSCLGSASSFDWDAAHTVKAVARFRSCPVYAEQGVRHLCENMCYYRAYEPCRKWHLLRKAAVEAGRSTGELEGWKSTIDFEGGVHAASGPQRTSWHLYYESPLGARHATVADAIKALQKAPTSPLPKGTEESPTAPSPKKRRLASLLRSPGAIPDEGGQQRRVVGPCTIGPAHLLKQVPAVPSDGASERLPPVSPFGLLEELLTDDPWKLLLSCIMLNQTSRAQVDPVLARFLKQFDTAEAAARADVSQVEEIVRPLGLNQKRAPAIIRFSDEYLHKDWGGNPSKLHWVGKYGVDAHSIFIQHQWQDVEPNDHALNWYMEWLKGSEASADGDNVPGKKIGELSTKNL